MYSPEILHAFLVSIFGFTTPCIGLISETEPTVSD